MVERLVVSCIPGSIPSTVQKKNKKAGERMWGGGERRGGKLENLDVKDVGSVQLTLITSQC